MNLIEADKIMECIGNDIQTIFSDIDKNCDSYWEEKNADFPCVLEYGFDTPVDMMNMLSVYIENEKLRKKITADSFKGHNEKLTVQASNEKVTEEEVKLPEYVYVF